MNDNVINDLPQIFNPYKDKIIQSQKTTIVLTLGVATDLALWQSKMGGHPYLPLGMRYPSNANGEKLQMIAQINFAELPPNEIYPTQGILQFYIDAEDDLTGLNFDDQTDQTGFRVIFHEHTTQDISQLQPFDAKQVIDYEYSPVRGEYAIAFKVQQQYISVMDQSFAPLMFDVDDIYAVADHFEGGDFYEDFLEVYADKLNSDGHRLGGYPYFTQSDPRYKDELKEYELLLQIDTDDQEDVDIMWGDVGVANFFILPQDLKNKDFSKVLYNWDCH